MTSLFKESKQRHRNGRPDNHARELRQHPHRNRRTAQKAARSAAARNVNSIMTAAYWEIGRRIVQSEQRRIRQAIGGTLAKDLSKRFGRGFGNANLWTMRTFDLTWPSERILSTLSRESDKSSSTSDLSSTSSTILALAPVPPEARNFPDRALRSGWSVRPLDRQFGSQFLRTYRTFAEQSSHAPEGSLRP
jgi:hypothetical protein